MEFIKQQTTETIEINSKFPEKKLNAEWMSYDKNVHKVVVPVRTQSGIAFQMDEVEEVLVYLKYSKGSFGPFDGKVEDEEQRTVSFEIPDEVRGQTGTVSISVMLNLSAGRQVDLVKFTATARLSAVDSEAPAMQEYYLPMYEDLVADIEVQKKKFDAASIYNKAEVDSKVNPLASGKADKTYVDSMLSSISQGGPRELFYSLAALKSKYPSGADGTYLVFDSTTTDGAHSYMWDKSLPGWKDLGVYQAKEIGVNAVNTTNIVDGAAINSKLASAYAYTGQIVSGVSVNTARKQGVYLVQNGALDVPSGVRALTHLINENANDRWFLQTLVYYNTSNAITKIWMRRFDINNPPIPEWTTIFDGDIKYRQNVQKLSSKDANTIDADGDYFVSTTTNQPIGAAAAGFLRDYSPDQNFKLQEFFDRGGNYYFRFLDLLSKPQIKDTAFKRILTTDDIKQVSLDKPLVDKVVVQFGDSILGNKTEPNDISSVVNQITGATVYNCGFSGCRMSYGKYPRPWEAFSMIKLSEAIVSGDWSNQDAAIADTTQGYPAYFVNTLARIKAINFDKVDYITIRYGTNDWSADVVLDNANDKYDIETFGGSLRKSIETILGKYPKIRFLIQTPGYRFYFDESGEFLEDSDSKKNSHNVLLTQFVELCKTISTDYKIICQDDYFKLGFNKFNRKAFFDGVDGVHPNIDGTRIIGEKTAYSLINLV